MNFISDQIILRMVVVKSHGMFKFSFVDFGLCIRLLYLHGTYVCMYFCLCQAVLVMFCR